VLLLHEPAQHKETNLPFNICTLSTLETDLWSMSHTHFHSLEMANQISQDPQSMFLKLRFSFIYCPLSLALAQLSESQISFF